MRFPPNTRTYAPTRAKTVAPKQSTHAVQGQPHEHPSVPRQDTVAISEAAKDLAAQGSGTMLQEEVGERPAVDAKEALANVAGNPTFVPQS